MEKRMGIENQSFLPARLMETWVIFPSENEGEGRERLTEKRSKFTENGNNGRIIEVPS